MEAWIWLEREGLIAPKPGVGVGSEDEYFITRRGKKIKTIDDYKSYQHANLVLSQIFVSKTIYGKYKIIKTSKNISRFNCLVKSTSICPCNLYCNKKIPSG